MLERYLNKEVEVLTQIQGTALSTKYEGMITDIGDEFIEINNRTLISKKFLYRITIKNK